jgi:gamma-glutamyltranspeptidase/glutathione hydrolase
LSILAAGGNAVDAAIAVSYMLGVAEPYASGIGGGGVMLIAPVDGNEPIVFDYREVAPSSGIISSEEVGVPGFVLGMEALHESSGTMELRRLIEPAALAAESGFMVGATMHNQLNQAQHLVRDHFPQFYKDGVPFRIGESILQPELAHTLRALQEYGSAWFYKGEPAKTIAGMIEGIEDKDFENYRVSMRAPVYSEYGGYKVITSPPPFGGVTLMQALRMSEALSLPHYPERSSAYLHLWGEVMGHCYTIRKTTMGDPQYSNPPVDQLISRELAKQLAARIRPDARLEIAATLNDVANTTHFTVVDRAGTLVSATNTIGGFFGPGLAVGGFFLNNQLRNFTPNPDSPNRPEPGKRPQSYVCPTILKNDKQAITIGSAGGKRIPLTLSTILVNMVHRQYGLEEAVAETRFFIDEGVVTVETPLSAQAEKELISLGYKVVHNADPMFYGGVHGLALSFETGLVSGAADPRRGGAWQTGSTE